MNSSQLPRKIQAGLALLLEASLYAKDAACNLWDFGVEISRLHAAGMNESDLRWLVHRGYVEHTHEITLPGDEGRTFRRVGKLTFTTGSCFILTGSGVRLASEMANANTARPPGDNNHPTSGGNGQTTAGRPHWDPLRRQLSVGEFLIKRFSVPAPNQELILSAFEESGWANRIDDPLPPSGENQPKRRLHSTINGLNRNRNNGLIRFRGDGSGRGICWELAHEELSKKG